MKLLLHLSILFTILLITLPSSHSCSFYEKRALLQIKKSLFNPSALSSWNSKSDCCSGWTGVRCTNFRVTDLEISDIKVYAQIPTQIGDLPDLKELDITFMPHLTGTIPRTITKLKNLDFLRITDTGLSGPIPHYISELKNLKVLFLASNQFTGPIPGSLSRLPKLETLYLSYNKLTGPIPYALGLFAGNLRNLYLSNNKLSGRIPRSLSKYDFNAVDLSGNSFIGDASMFFGQNKTTAKVDLSKNKFQFDLSKVKFAKTIFSLDLSHNRIYGKLPWDLSKLLILTEFNVSYNLLCGKIPRGGRLQTFYPSEYAHNLCLCGAPLKPC